MKSGVPPTPRKARTGEFTPPGINSSARAYKVADLLCLGSGFDIGKRITRTDSEVSTTCGSGWVRGVAPTHPLPQVVLTSRRIYVVAGWKKLRTVRKTLRKNRITFVRSIAEITNPAATTMNNKIGRNT